ncbi:hypothetical protein Btru_016440 [Bulinus truncatus]|nr:hypothetical protein Btru_016440 [Bulinus truncatus]
MDKHEANFQCKDLGVDDVVQCRHWLARISQAELKKIGCSYLFSWLLFIFCGSFLSLVHSSLLLWSLEMSPPKVSLAGKSIDKPAFDEIMPEKTDLVEFPAVINVETERRAWNLRQQRKKQRCRRIVCGALIVIIVAVAALGTMLLVLHFRHHQRKHGECRRRGLLETVDHENQLIYSKHEHDLNSQAPDIKVLHNYDRGLIAYKDMDNNKCYIDRLDETFEDDYECWQLDEKSEHGVSKTLKIISGPIELDVLKHIGDIHITAHCENAVSVWVMEIDIQEKTTERNVIKI